MNAHRLRFWLRISILCLTLTFTAGCYPGITWLPDSSGFVYTGGKDDRQLLLYHLEKKTTHVIAADAGGPAWPMVSPEGKRFAVAHASRKGGDLVLMVTVFDPEGNVVHRSGELPWGRDDRQTGHKHNLPWGTWARDRDRLVIYLASRTGVYDLKEKRVTKVPGSLLPFHGGPTRPDGKGVLTVVRKQVFVVDWDGKVKAIDITPTPKTNSETPFPTDSYHVYPCIRIGPILNYALFFNAD